MSKEHTLKILCPLKHTQPTETAGDTAGRPPGEPAGTAPGLAAGRAPDRAPGVAAGRLIRKFVHRPTNNTEALKNCCVN